VAKVKRGRARIRSDKPKGARKPDAMSMDRKTTRTHYEAREIASEAPARKEILNDNKKALDTFQATLKPIRSRQK
jgi:hypothetical protein